MFLTHRRVIKASSLEAFLIYTSRFDGQINEHHRFYTNTPPLLVSLKVSRVVAITSSITTSSITTSSITIASVSQSSQSVSQVNQSVSQSVRYAASRRQYHHYHHLLLWSVAMPVSRLAVAFTIATAVASTWATTTTPTTPNVQKGFVQDLSSTPTTTSTN